MYQHQQNSQLCFIYVKLSKISLMHILLSNSAILLSNSALTFIIRMLQFSKPVMQVSHFILRGAPTFIMSLKGGFGN